MQPDENKSLIKREMGMHLKKLMAAMVAVGLASTALAAEEEKLARVEVTGSSLKRINAETASPVQVINAKQIENMGALTLLQVLDNLPAARPAQQDFRSMFTGSDGGSQANLRGLGARGAQPNRVCGNWANAVLTGTEGATVKPR